MKKSFRKRRQFKRRKSIFRNRFFWLGVLILLIGGGIFYLVCFFSFFQIREIKISGNQKVSNEEIQNIVRPQIEKQILFFPSRSILLIDSNKVKKGLLEIPQIAEVNLKRDFPDVIVLKVEEREPIGIWCQGEDCFLIDKEGVIFEENSLDAELIIRTQEAKSTVLGSAVIEKDCLNSILEIRKRLRENFQIEIEEFIVFSSERLNVKTVEGWEIYFNPEGDLEWQLTKLKAVLEEEIPSEKRKELEHIELRFGNFAPYK